MTYKLKPKFLKKSEILERNSFTSKDYLVMSNNNFILLKEMLKKSFINSNIDSSFYIKKSDFYLLTNKLINSDSLLLDEKKLISVTPDGFKTKNSCIANYGDILIGNNGSLGDVLFLKSDKNIITNSNLTLLRIRNIKKSFYLLGVFYTKWFKKYCHSISSKSSTQEFITRDALDNSKIPFPTTKNNSNPENVEKMVSLIVQNLIHKEEQIKLKNTQIDEQIEKELQENQTEKTFQYKFPRISEIKKEGRLDTGLYEKEFKEIDFLVKGYKWGNFTIDKKNIKGGNTPKERIFGKGNLWLTPTDVNFGILGNKSLIQSVKYNLNKDSLVIVNRSNVAQTILFQKELFGKAQHNQGMYRVKIEKEKYENYLFILSWFNSKIFQKYITQIATGATFKEIRVEDISEKSFIPNFPEQKQKEIAKLYYNTIEKKSDLTLENYLEKEKIRNEKLGIFQLNMEIFDLREKLENLVYKIVMEEKIEVSF